MFPHFTSLSDFLNDLERHNSPYLRFSTEFDSFAGQLLYVTVVEDRPI